MIATRTFAFSVSLFFLSVLPAGRAVSSPPEPQPDALRTNRQWDVLTPAEAASPRLKLKLVGERLASWTITLAGQLIDANMLTELAQTPEDEPLLRAAREKLRRPVDLEDLLYFLDDLLREEERLRGRLVWVTPGRARKAGILVHPSEIFGKGHRVYGKPASELRIDKPKEPEQLEPAEDGDLLGPRWTARYPNPTGEQEKLAALAELAPSKTFHERINSLLAQLRDAGADVLLSSTVRRRERGYLMWGAFILSRAKSELKVERILAMLGRLNGSWKLNIPIRWRHPEGWPATVEAARQMADAYDVVYATKRGASKSDHYDGVAADLTAVALPRELTLRAPDGAERTFDLSAPEQTRDLSLTPEVIDWIEQHFQLEKLRSDYPHWNDTATPQVD